MTLISPGLLRSTRSRASTLLVLFGCAALITIHARAQGSVNFANNSSTRVYYYASSGANTFIPVGSQFTAELVYAPDGTPLNQFDADAIRVGNTTTFGPIAGAFNGGGRTVQSLSPAGGFGLFQVRVWETAMGADYRSAIASGNPNGQAGTSAILRVDTGDPTTIPPGTPRSLVSAGLTSFCVTPLFATPPCIPEPSTAFIGVLGLGALILLGRARKRTKHLLLLLGCVALITTNARAQGSVQFANNVTTRVFCSFDQQPIPVGSAFQAELMYAPDGASSDSAFDAVAIRVGAPANFGPIAGLFSGGGRTVQNMPAGGFGMFQVRVWETAYGNSYREVLALGNVNAHAGKSAILRVDTGDPTLVPPQVPTSLVSAGLTSFTIGPLSTFVPCIPEPSILVLTFCGLAALWCCQIRKT